MHHIVIHGFVDGPRRVDCTAVQMDGEACWWTANGKIGIPHYQGEWEWADNNNIHDFLIIFTPVKAIILP